MRAKITTTVIVLLGSLLSAHSSANAAGTGLFQVPYIANNQNYSIGVLYSTELKTGTPCITAKFIVGTPWVGVRSDVDLEMQLMNEKFETSETYILSEARHTWSPVSNSTNVYLEICGLDQSSGAKNVVQILTRVISSRGNGQEYVGTVSSKFLVVGTAATKQLVCFRGSESKTIRATNPTCPTGWVAKKASGASQGTGPITIKCVKGLSVRKVTGLSPICPAGYKRQ